MPSLRNSLWIRGAPQRGFADTILSTSVRMAASVLGRPGCVCRDRSGPATSQPEGCENSSGLMPLADIHAAARRDDCGVLLRSVWSGPAFQSLIAHPVVRGSSCGALDGCCNDQ